MQRETHNRGPGPSRAPRTTCILGICLAVALSLTLALSLSAAAGAVDVHFDRAPVHEVFRILAEAEGVNLIVDQGVTGEISMTAREMEAREAMELVAAVRGLHLQQVGNTLIVSAAPTAIGDRVGPPQAAVLNFTQRPVLEVVQALAERAGWNLIAEASLDREITAWLEGMEPVEALRLVAAAAGLSYQLVDRVLHIKGVEAPPADRVAIYRIDHVDTAKAKELIEAFLPQVRVQVDPGSRSLVVQGSEQQLQEVAALLSELDTPMPQVLVEARILDVEVEALRSLGVEWPSQTQFSGNPEVIALDWNPAQLNATLRFLEDQGYSQVLASPKISAVDGQTAKMLIGERRPIVTEFTDPDGRVFQQVDFIDVGIVLQMTPTIAADGSVMLKVHTEVSSVEDPNARFPTVRTREADTTVRVQDGRPLIIGGLIQEEERERLTGIPLLNQLPVLGGLFGQHRTENVQMETIIILVPRVVNAAGESVAQTPAGSGTGAGSTARAAAHTGAAAGSATEATPTFPVDLQPGEAIESTQALIRSTGTPVLSRPERDPGSMAVSLDMMTARHPAVELQLERQQGNVGMLSRVYASTGSHSGAWGLGIALRYYLAHRDRWPGLQPWVDAGVEYTLPLHDDPMVVYTAGAGLQLSVGERALVELYGRYQHPERSGGLIGLPGRAAAYLLSVKLGWRY